MSDPRMIARLADLREFAELKTHFEERREAEAIRFGKASMANPEAHDQLEAHKLKAFYAGVDAVLGLPLKARRGTTNQEGTA